MNNINLKIIVISVFGLLAPFGNLFAQQKHEISTNGKLRTLTEAIEFANPGDTLIINEGVYRESDILIDKSLIILGNGNAVIDGENKGYTITVRAENVVIRDFEIRNSGRSYMTDYAGLLVDKSKNVLIENMRMRDNFFGIFLSETQYAVIRNNEISASVTKESSSANGIHLWYNKDIEIYDNLVYGHRDGYYFEFVEDVKVYNNIARNNLRYGLHFMFSKRNNYYDNEFEANGAGVAVMYSSKVDMKGNTFKNNWGSASYGLLLKEIDDSEIENNIFDNNSIGLYMEASGRNHILNNHFTQNGWAIKLMANSMDNQFMDNNFIANTFELTTNSRQNFNHFEGNYWSQYDGYDLDRDGFGDVPHRPVRMFAVVIQNHPQSLIMLRSTLISLLDATEKFLPVLTPDKLIDEKPRMREIK